MSILDKAVINELDSMFKEVKDLTESDLNEFESLPDGKYVAEVDDIEVTTSKASGNPMVKLSYKVLDGQFAGVTHMQFLMLSGSNETQLRRNLNRYATTVKKLGVDTTGGLSKSFDTFGNALGKRVIVALDTTIARNGNKYTNTSIELL